jgi:tRNA 5-methylaminomethyl-2-thiouridine biosynthesis bifunctional protein
LNIAHGSRGITGTPLCADLLADRLSRRAPPADQALVAALAPERFILRKRKKQPDWSP